MSTVKKSSNELARTLSGRGDPYKIMEEELGSAVKEYRHKWLLAEKELIEFEYPLHLNLELVYGCNQRCEFCIFSLPRDEWKYNARPKDRISFEKYRQIIDEGVKRGLCSVSLNGYNEPLLQRDIAKYINYAHKAGVLDISLHTNGVLLTEKLSKELIDSGLTMIMFSVDAATNKTYEKIRQSRDYGKVVKNIMRFLELKKGLNCILPLTRVSFVETKVNYLELDEFTSLWKDKVDFFTIQSFCNSFVGKGIYETIENDYRLNDTPFVKCSEPYQRLTVTCDGNVLPCCSNYGLELIVGNIYQNSIYEIWNSEKMKKIRSRVNSIGENQLDPCKKCRASFVSNISKDAERKS